jgi:hypothetical protein
MKTIEINKGIFSGEKFIHNSFLNILGIHIFRILIANIFFSLRSISFFSKLTEEQKILRKDGILIIENFFPDDKFESIKNEFKNSKNYDGNNVEIPDGDSFWFRRKFNLKQIENLPNTKDLLLNKRLLDLVSAAEARKVTFNAVWFDEVSHVDNKTMDSQKVLHTDIFYNNHKVFYFISDVKDEDGPLNFAPGSHRLSLKRLWFEYKKSNTLTDEKREARGSFRVNEKDKSFLGLKNIKAIVPANSLVIINPCAFHRRGDSSIGSKRSAIFLQFRKNPFSLK